MKKLPIDGQRTKIPIDDQIIPIDGQLTVGYKPHDGDLEYDGD